MTLDPRTPVLVGVGQVKQQPKDIAEAVEAVKLMEQVVTAAAHDAGAPELLGQLDAIAVINGSDRGLTAANAAAA